MAEAAHNENNQYLTFTLGDELFALEIFIIREVLEYTQITRIPRTETYLRGIINVRGNAVPVIDLNMKFGKGITEQSVDTCIIIVEVEMDGDITTIGALADSVQEVFDMPSNQIDPPPKMGTSIRAEYIKGMGRHGERFVMVLDINKVFTSSELAAIQEASGGGE